jgi:DNA-binding response OmpR family regulator
MNPHPLRVLVVEDEMLIAFFIEDCLNKLGYEVVGPACRVANASLLVNTEAFDLALLDINVAGEEIYPVASELRTRGIPFIFLSGYGSSCLSGEWKNSPILPKPFAPEALEKAVIAAMRG